MTKTGATPLDLFVTMMAIDAMYPGSVTGGKRTRTRNARVKGHPNSRHLLWGAWDLVLDDPKQKASCMAEYKRQGYKATLSNNGAIHVQLP